MGREVTVPLIVDRQGALHVAAADVSKLLRTLGGQWLRMVHAGNEALDEDTVAALTIELAKLADRIDVACIAHSSSAPEAPGARRPHP
ncbi:DUF6213 family protein [Streptomyces jeddahensis]|uniref:Uncharacterized protein n=1 Tax=Streptomyces jeddahensis TaxID=1716141 RepID=A0A177HK80_9ACTN|nr:DUF6213 family protein [Streptomyces jeddahensis]OAH11020.1 hypothetical protein STSP_56440 [Streptomyces jeddahensis]